MLMCRYSKYEEFEDVARLFQEELRHNELVFSDVMAAFILLSEKQSETVCAIIFFCVEYIFGWERCFSEGHRMKRRMSQVKSSYPCSVKYE